MRERVVSQSPVNEGPDLPVRIRTVPLGGSALSRTLQDPAGAAAWGMPRPASAAAWRTRVEAVRAGGSGGAWLAALAPAFGGAAEGGGVAGARLARAAAAGVVVTTGQQPGLFGGPAYTLSKALAALALADELEESLGCPVAPVFWAATDDADWAEAAEVHLSFIDGVRRLALEGPPTDGVAMADVPLGPMAPLHAALAAACGSGAHGALLEATVAAYGEGGTVGGAYVRWLRHVLEPLGIAVLDAAHPAVRLAADPVLRQALAQAAPVQAALEARDAALRDAGLAPQVELVPGRSLVFRLRPDAEGRPVRERVPLDEAEAALREAPAGTLGANVLLRPVVERALLPTAAYVAGPGELAYGAQVAVVADALGREQPLLVPRWAGEVVETRALEAASALGLSEDDLATPHRAEARVARARMDGAVADGMERLRLAIEAQVGALRTAVLDAGVPVPARTVEGLARDLARRVDRHERRLLAAVKRQEGEAMRQVAMVRGALRPLGRPPERTLSLVPLLVRHGPGLLRRMGDLARAHARALVQGPAGGA